MNSQEIYKKNLDDQLLIKSKEKYIIYEIEIDKHNDELTKIQFYFSKLTQRLNEKYSTKFAFKNYILIRESIYKSIKKIINDLEILFCDDICSYRCLCKKLSESAKFLKSYYNKSFIIIDGIRYIKIKLRSLNNVFVLTGDLFYRISLDKYRLLYGENSIKFIAIPIKNPHTNLIHLLNWGGFNKNDYKIVDKGVGFTLYLTNVYDGYKKILEETIEYIRNNEKIILMGDYYIQHIYGFIENNNTEKKKYITIKLYVPNDYNNLLIKESQLRNEEKRYRKIN